MNSQLIVRHYRALLRRLGITVASCSATDTVYNAHNAADERCCVGSRAWSCSTRPGGATTYSYDGNGPVFANPKSLVANIWQSVVKRCQAG